MDYLKVTPLLIIAIMALMSTNSVDATPVKMDLYSGWGEPYMPFSLTHAKYDQKNMEKFEKKSSSSSTTLMTTTTTTTTTMKPWARKPRKLRKIHPTKNPSDMPQLFVSNGWGPLGK